MTKIAETIDRIPDEKLIYVIHNSNEFKWNFFAVQIILTRLRLKITMFENDHSILPGCCEELRNMLKKSSGVPNLLEDLKQILSVD